MFNNPYNYYPYMNMTTPIVNNAAMGTSLIRPRPSLFKGLSNIKWGEVLTNTQKTLNVINQAIPVYYQIKPIFHNVKSFGRLVSAFNSSDEIEKNESTNNIIKKDETSSNAPTFFIN